MPGYIKAKRGKKKFCAKKSRKRKENGVLIKIPPLNMILNRMILNRQNKRKNKQFSFSFALIRIMHSTTPN